MHAQVQEVPLHKLAVDESITYHMNGHMPHGTPISVFSEIAQAFGKESHLLKVLGADLCASFVEGNAILALAYNRKEPVGYSRVTRLLGDDDEIAPWWELGSTWVREDYRGRGVNRMMYEIFLPKLASRNVLATTTNPNSYAIGREIGMVDVRRSEIPKRLWLASCVCPVAKMSAGSAQYCKRAYGDDQQDDRAGEPCRFRLTSQTAIRLGK